MALSESGDDIRRRARKRQIRQSLQSVGALGIIQALTFLATAAIGVASLYYTNRTLQTTQQQIVIAQDGQRADRYGKAVELLGAENVDARLGGIYALGHLAQDSKLHHAAVIDVLAAYLRRHTPTPDKCDKSTSRDAPLPQPDVQAALSIVGHRNTKYDDDSTYINLRGLCFVGVDLSGGNFAGSNFLGSTFWRIKAKGTNFAKADFREVYIVSSDLAGADLTCVIQMQYFKTENSDLSGVIGTWDDTGPNKRPKCD